MPVELAAVAPVVVVVVVVVVESANGTGMAGSMVVPVYERNLGWHYAALAALGMSAQIGIDSYYTVGPKKPCFRDSVRLDSLPRRAVVQQQQLVVAHQHRVDD
jgi:hypothetical protein